MPNANRGIFRAGLVLLALAAVLLTAPVPVRAQGGDRDRLFVAATVGPDKVLLRWSGGGRLSGFAGFNVRRREAGGTVDTLMNASPVRPLTDPAAVRAVFEAPGEEGILADIRSILGDDYATALLSLRNSPASADRMKLRLLVNTNYGVALVEGRGFLDRSAPSGRRYTYEVWGLDGAGAEVERLGKVSVTAGLKTVLPAPANPEWVPIYGPAGDRKVHLRWDGLPAADLRKASVVGFGYDVYRMTGLPSPPGKILTDAEIAADPATYVKVNDLPVVILPAASSELGRELFGRHCSSCHSTRNDPAVRGKGPAEFRETGIPAAVTAHGALPPELDLQSVFNYVNDFFFVDDPALSGAPPLGFGTYTYWVVGRDLLRQHGLFSQPVVAESLDTRPPMVPYNVRAEETGSVPNRKIRIFWDRNRDELNPENEPGKYQDDTVLYRVYRRFGGTDSPRTYLGDVPQPPPSVYEVEFVDTTITEAQWGNIYWYHVTAVDAAGNESAFSGPAKGVVYDRVAPGLPDCRAFCEDPNNQQEMDYCRVFDPDQEGNSNYAVVSYADVRDPTAPVYPLFVCTRLADEDVSGVKIYRSIDGVDFHLLREEWFADGAGGLVFEDREYRPRVSQEVYYRFRAFDENMNEGPLGPVSIRHFILGDPPPPPSIVGMRKVGENTIEQMDIVEIRFTAIATDGLAGFNVYRSPTPEESAVTAVGSKPYPPERWGRAINAAGDVRPAPLEGHFTMAGLSTAAAGDLVFDPTAKLYTIRVHVNPPSTGFYYTVVAYDFAGQASSPMNFFFWSGQDPSRRVLHWPVRPEAGIKPLTVTPDTTNRRKICLDWEITGDLVNNEFVYDETRYAVFRVRGAAPPDAFVQISPLILGPFYRPADMPEYCDTDVIFGQQYTYEVLGFSADGEIVTSFGPAAGTVVYTP